LELIAGKSTTIKAILGLVKEMKGSIHFEEKSKYAYIPEQPVYYDHLTLWEHLGLAAASRQMDPLTWERKANHLLEYFQMHDVKHHFPSSFSKGMKQKVMLITAFIVNQKFLLSMNPLSDWIRGQQRIF
jgi:ABC-2 type transport system ATP-binding protein